MNFSYSVFRFVLLVSLSIATDMCQHSVVCAIFGLAPSIIFGDDDTSLACNDVSIRFSVCHQGSHRDHHPDFLND